jgi:dodecin
MIYTLMPTFSYAFQKHHEAQAGLSSSYTFTGSRYRKRHCARGIPLSQVLPDGQRTFRRGRTMSDHVYKIIQLVGSSPTSVEGAVQNAVERASKKLKNLRWFEVLETRGNIENGKVSHYQVTLKVGFTLDDTIDTGA